MTKRTLFMDVKVGQSLYIDGARIVITLEDKSGRLAKLKIVHEGASVERTAPEERRGRSGAAQAMLGIKAA